MEIWKRCGSTITLEYTKHGCGKMRPSRKMLRCWHCGALLCEECYVKHREKYKLNKGGEK